MSEIKLIAPLYLSVAGEDIYLSYNNIRKMEVFKELALKREFIKRFIKGISDEINPIISPCHIEMNFYFKNTMCDLDNIFIVTKYVLDALVNNFILTNDTAQSVPKITHNFMGIDIVNPRAEITIYF
jgi:hypothetical protein